MRTIKLGGNSMRKDYHWEETFCFLPRITIEGKLVWLKKVWRGFRIHWGSGLGEYTVSSYVYSTIGQGIKINQL